MGATDKQASTGHDGVPPFGTESVAAPTTHRIPTTEGKTMQGDEELLIELATLDEVEAYVPAAVDHDAEVVPSWCELVFAMKRTDDWPINVRIPLRRHDGELIIEVLDQVLHPDRLGGAAAQMWADLDRVVERIQRRVERGKSPRNDDVIKAQVLSRCIALVTNHRDPDIEEVKEVAMERYEDRHPNVA